MALSKKVTERLVSGIKRFQPIIANSKARDDGEADTVTIVKDMLADVFGYDKYNEITAEYAIRGTYCDLAVKIDGNLQMLIEVKAIGTSFKENHIKQAIDYATNQGIEWVILTNANNWRVFKVGFGKPISYEVVVDLDFSSLSHKRQDDLEMLYLWCKEGWVKSVVGEYYEQKQSLNRYYVGAVIQSETVLKTIRQELRRLSPNVKIDVEQIKAVLVSEVLKREVLEGDKAMQANKKLSRMAVKNARVIKEEKSSAPLMIDSLDSGDEGEAAIG